MDGMKSHVDTVRTSILTFAGHGLDIDALTPLWALDAEWDLSRFEDWSSGVCRGPGEILAMVGQWLGQFATYDLSIDDPEGHGDHGPPPLRPPGPPPGAGGAPSAAAAQ